MKKIFYSLAVIATSALTLFSCSSEPDAITLTPKSVAVRGDLSEYFEVVDRKYTLVDDWGKMIKVELKKIKEMPYDKSVVRPYGTSGYNIERLIGFGIKIFDKEGALVEQTSASASGLSGCYSSDDVLNFVNIEVGETGIIRWTLDSDDPETLKTLATFEINSVTEDTKYNSSVNWGDNTEESSSSAVEDNSSSSDSDSSDSYSSDSSSEDWDEVLDEYEDYVTDYISVMKKVNSGDMSAMTEAASMLQSANSLSSKLSGGKSELNSSQVSRLASITAKMASAAASL